MTEDKLGRIKKRYVFLKRMNGNITSLELKDIEELISEIDRSRILFQTILEHSCHCDFAHKVASAGLSLEVIR